MGARFTTVVVAAVLLSPAAALADFEGVLVSKISGDMNGTAKTWLSKAGMRSETELTVPEGQQALAGKTVRSTVIMKVSEPNRTYLLDENRKTYHVLEHTPGERGGGDDRYTAKKIGKDTVAGFSCDKVVLTGPSGTDSELCVAPALGGSDTWLRVFQEREKDGSPHGMWQALKDAGVKGLPVRWTRAGKDGHGRFQMELVSATKQSVPASTFAVPADYKETQMPTPFSSPESAKRMEDAMKNLTPEQRKQMEEMMKKFGGGQPSR